MCILTSHSSAQGVIDYIYKRPDEKFSTIGTSLSAIMNCYFYFIFTTDLLLCSNKISLEQILKTESHNLNNSINIIHGWSILRVINAPILPRWKTYLSWLFCAMLIAKGLKILFWFASITGMLLFACYSTYKSGTAVG